MHHNQRAYDTWGKKIQLKITKSIGIIFRKQFLVIIGQKKSIEHETEWKGEESDNLKNVDKHVSSLFFLCYFLKWTKLLLRISFPFASLPSLLCSSGWMVSKFLQRSVSFVPDMALFLILFIIFPLFCNFFLLFFFILACPDY